MLYVYIFLCTFQSCVMMTAILTIYRHEMYVVLLNDCCFKVNICKIHREPFIVTVVLRIYEAQITIFLIHPPPP